MCVELLVHCPLIPFAIQKLSIQTNLQKNCDFQKNIQRNKKMELPNQFARKLEAILKERLQVKIY